MHLTIKSVFFCVSDDFQDMNFLQLWFWFKGIGIGLGVGWFGSDLTCLRQVLDTCTVRMWSTEISSTLLKPKKPWRSRFWSLRASQQRMILQSYYYCIESSSSKQICFSIHLDHDHHQDSSSRFSRCIKTVIIYRHGSWIMLDYTKAWEHPHLI